MSAPAANARLTIQFTLPRIVLISPLCAICRNGCAKLQRGIVFVEKRPVLCRVWVASMAWVCRRGLAGAALEPAARRRRVS